MSASQPAIIEWLVCSHCGLDSRTCIPSHVRQSETRQPAAWWVVSADAAHLAIESTSKRARCSGCGVVMDHPDGIAFDDLARAHDFSHAIPRAVLWALRVPVAPLKLTRASQSCPVFGCGRTWQSKPCTYRTPTSRNIDGRCLTREAAERNVRFGLR